MVSGVSPLSLSDFQPGVSPYSTQTVPTGTGTGQFYNITNTTGKTQTFVFSSQGRVLATMTLKDGETGTFEAGPNTPGIRISTSGANGETNPNQVLFEDNVEIRDGHVVHSPDISNVDGDAGYDGNHQYITATDGTHLFGNGTEIGSYDYDVEDLVRGPDNPMQLAWSENNTYNLVFSSENPDLI